VRRRYNPPSEFDPRLIVDPQRPIPKHLSRKKALQLQELREAYQWSLGRKRADRLKFDNPEKVAEFLFPLMSNLRVEHMYILPMDVRARLIGSPVAVSVGDIDGVDAGARMIFRIALEADANSIIIAHNHPSGDPSPSAADLAVTRQVYAAGRLLGIVLNDHLIIGANGLWYSIRRDRPDAFA